MFTRPPFFPVAAMTLAIAVMVYLVVTPVIDDSWAAPLAPMNYSRWAIERAYGVFVAPVTAECGAPNRLGNAWRTIAASPSGDSVFRHLFVRAKPAGRLYALLGLARDTSRGFVAAVAKARRDTAKVYTWRAKNPNPEDVPLRDFAIPESLRVWAHQLATTQVTRRCEY
ncbi:MAG TPA: hypothetical protein VN674_12410 [Gemmatimonadales bacterium]|nr:hypothetical protein [Gemmatimonadales bacterium]